MFNAESMSLNPIPGDDGEGGEGGGWGYLLPPKNFCYKIRTAIDFS